MEALDDSLADANTYLPFKAVDSAVVTGIGHELDSLGDMDEEGECMRYQRTTCLG